VIIVGAGAYVTSHLVNVPVVEEVETTPIVVPDVITVEPRSEIAEPIIDNTDIFVVTAYCPCERCCGKSDGITATGVKATAGRTVAVDPTEIPYGTEVIVNGHTYIAEDCGGAIKGNRIDIYFDSHQEALAFGVQNLEGVIIG
jgi:3D (Asp-Asp-Asp) domain-containing protein